VEQQHIELGEARGPAPAEILRPEVSGQSLGTNYRDEVSGRLVPRKGCYMKRISDAVLSLLHFLREALSEDGQGSWSRVGSAIVVTALVFVMISTCTIPERTEELAWDLAALYGANRLGRMGQSFAEISQRKLSASSQTEGQER